MSKGKLIGIIVGVVCIVAAIIIVATGLLTHEEAADYESARLVVEATTELHQAQTAIIAAMADAESDNLTWSIPPNNPHGLSDNWWAGEAECIKVLGADGTTWCDAVDYCYGSFRAAYFVETADTNPEHVGVITNGNPLLSGGGGWGSGIVWNSADNCWAAAG